MAGVGREGYADTELALQGVEVEAMAQPVPMLNPTNTMEDLCLGAKEEQLAVRRLCYLRELEVEVVVGMVVP
jgi:hypothetical protein